MQNPKKLFAKKCRTFQYTNVFPNFRQKLGQVNNTGHNIKKKKKRSLHVYSCQNLDVERHTEYLKTLTLHKRQVNLSLVLDTNSNSLILAFSASTIWLLLNWYFSTSILGFAIIVPSSCKFSFFIDTSNGPELFSPKSVDVSIALKSFCLRT